MNKAERERVSAPMAGHGAPMAPHGPVTGSALQLRQMLAEAQDHFTALLRAMAGYSQLVGALEGMLPQDPQVKTDGRRMGLPILKFTGSVDGKTPIEINTDLKRLSPAHVEAVLAPMAHLHLLDLREAVEEVTWRMMQIAVEVGCAVQEPSMFQPYLEDIVQRERASQVPTSQAGVRSQ